MGAIVTSMSLSTTYEPQTHEPLYTQWEDAGAFKPSGVKGRPYVIMLPPPNITGTLHMGHALQDTIIDVLIRYHRLKGEPTLWLPGTDHAAIATNKVIEKQLAAEGKTRGEIGREEFLKRTSEWYAKTGAEIIHQMKRLGCSCDWSRQRFTMDEGYVQAVNEAFLQYYKKGYIYRGKRIVNWDPATQTTVSDLEIEWQTQKTPLYTLQYGPFQITTARPETKFGDKYVVMHPDDERYAHYKDGQRFTAEWINGPIQATVIKDDSIDRAFGTGVMTITPWHDVTDFAIAQRHNLDMEPIIDLNGNLLPIAGEFAGMPITQARAKIVEKLQQKKLLVKIDENYEHNVALNERGQSMIEPQVMRQWFVNMQKLKGETINVVEKDMIQFFPPRWKKHFLRWMHEVRDWNINRQIWLGHRLPIWWKIGTHGTDHEEGNYVVSVEKPHFAPEGATRGRPAGDWQQDPDVLDTWFSSALWPFATLGWANATDDLKAFYPTSVLVTARDILYLWVARMIFSSLELTQQIPFHHVLIHPTVLTKTGQRMSKSLGTGVDPLDLINQYGADATRFGLLYQMSYDRQAIRFDEEGIRAARNFGNKIWNLARLLLSLPERDEVTVADQWIEQKSQQVIADTTQLLETMQLGEATRVLHQFIWSDFADWYVEIVKVQGSTLVARRIFTDMLRVLHPFMPYLTEVLWAALGQPGLLITNQWPSLTLAQPIAAPEAVMARFKDIVTTIRQVRTLLAIPPSTTIAIFLEEKPPLASALPALTRSRIVDHVQADMKHFPLLTGGSVAIGSEALTPESFNMAREKLNKEAQKLTRLIEKTKRILENMREKADPEAIAEKEAVLQAAQERLAEIERHQASLA